MISATSKFSLVHEVFQLLYIEYFRKQVQLLRVFLTARIEWMNDQISLF